ncbi:uncharacterized protein [Diadema setosum]|uniref:uncharacterized protein n=1 Tax=Diadema setosum TaxID=31175 RepID=UPI003B3BD767
MLCLMLWKDFTEERRTEMQKLQTFSNVFGEMISFLKRHYASKCCENLQNQNTLEYVEEAGRAIQDISDIAMVGLSERKLSFPEEKFKDCRDALETCCKVGVLTKEEDFSRTDRRRDINVLSSNVSTISFPHKLFQEYVAGLYIKNLFTDDLVHYKELKHKLLNRHAEFRYLLYFAAALENDLGLDIINDLKMTAKQYFCVDVAFECHTEEAARVVGERWKEYKLSWGTSEHTKSAIVFLVRWSQTQSLFIDNAHCGRTVSRDLAEAMCTSCVPLRVTIQDPELHADFYKILSSQASKCQIQDLTFGWSSRDGDYQNQSSIEGDLAQWVCAVPSLWSFSLTWPCFPSDFLSTAAASASRCQIRDLLLCVESLDANSQYKSSTGRDLALWVCAMRNLSRFSMRCSFLPEDFLSTASNEAQSCQIRQLNLWFSKTWISEPSAAHLAEFLYGLPHLQQAHLQCDNLPSIFFTTLASHRQRLNVETITINGKRLRELLVDIQCDTEMQ